MNKERIGIAMSGGVDSTACALSLLQHNSVEGFFMRLAQPDFDRQLARVEELAEKLAIPLTVVDLREPFRKKVLDYFANTYLQGATPNPCMICNHQIKFGLFLEAVLSAGMDRMATGHYARIVHEGNSYHLYDGLDRNKNQSYFLARLSQHQLSKVHFPLGDRQKQEIYRFVKTHGFTGFDGIESQDICFLADEDVGSFLERYAPHQTSPSGPIVSTDGKILGRHRGLYRYTIGQRRGLGIPDSSPFYVTGLDVAANTVIVGKTEDLMRSVITITDLHWLAGNPPDLERTYTVRLRYSHRGAGANLKIEGKFCTITFHDKQRAITPGQYAVVYDGDQVLGSGCILSPTSTPP